MEPGNRWLASLQQARSSGALVTVLREGSQLGGWMARRFIAEGGNGEVWEVEHFDGRRAALKLLKSRNLGSVRWRRFRREVETIASLADQPGILPLLEVHLPEQLVKGDRAWYVMPLAEPLSAALAGREVVETVEAVAGLARTLAGLHEQGIAHRDLKPANLLWHASAPSLVDFGLVRVPDEETISDPGRVPGSMGYMSDEVLTDPDGADPMLSDVFALAKVLWILLTPGSPYPLQGALRADGGSGTMARGLTVSHAASLDEVLAAATSPEPARTTMAQLADDLSAWLELRPATPLGEELQAAVANARAAMSDTLERRDQAASVAERAARAQERLIEACEPVLQVIVSVDPEGVQRGGAAVGSLYRLVEQPEETGSVVYGPPFHHGARVERTQSWGFEESLVAAFCLQVSETGEAAVTGLLAAGDETSTAGEVWPLAPWRGRRPATGWRPHMQLQPRALPSRSTASRPEPR